MSNQISTTSEEERKRYPIYTSEQWFTMIDPNRDQLIRLLEKKGFKKNFLSPDGCPRYDFFKNDLILEAGIFTDHVNFKIREKGKPTKFFATYYFTEFGGSKPEKILNYLISTL